MQLELNEYEVKGGKGMSDMQKSENKPLSQRSTVAIVGFVSGVLTDIVIVLVTQG